MLWPILHYRLDLAEFTRRDLGGYFRVNEFFAKNLETLLKPDDVVWVHEYNLIPLARALRERGHDILATQLWLAKRYPASAALLAIMARGLAKETFSRPVARSKARTPTIG